MTAHLTWSTLPSGDVVATPPRRRGRYVAREEAPGRWMLSGPRDTHEWTCGTLEEVQGAAGFIEARR